MIFTGFNFDFAPIIALTLSTPTTRHHVLEQQFGSQHMKACPRVEVDVDSALLVPEGTSQAFNIVQLSPTYAR